MITIDVESRIEQAARGVGAIEPEIRVARARALRKTARWLRREALRYVAAKERIPQKRLARRVFVSRVGNDDDTARVWFGLNPVDAVTIGTPRQTARGTRVGRRFYRGAFVARIYTSREKVWIRKSSRYYDPALYPVMRRRHVEFAPEGEVRRGRFPVVRAAIDVGEHFEKFLETAEGRVADEFVRRFDQEIRYAALHEVARP